MSTLTAAEITNLETVRANLISAMTTWSVGSPMTASYTIAGRTHEFKSIEEVMAAIENINKMLGWATAGNPASRVSYGRPRRF
jgi:hypothetical protein